jgi:transcriptional regulator with XRE-family HTH domain
MPPKREGSTAERAEQRIGPELKRLRERAGLSVRALAEEAGFSASFISQLENGVVSPSIASLEKIASMLGVTLGDLFTASEATDVAVVRADVRPSFRSSWSKARIEAIMPLSIGRSLEAMMVTLDPGGTSGKRPAAGSLDQLAVVFEGRLTLTLSGEQVKLDRGDAVLIRARAPRQWHNAGITPAQLLIVSSRLG